MNDHPTRELVLTAQALSLLSELAAKNPEMPAPYLTFSTCERAVSVGVQCRTLSDFEAWRVALGAETTDVHLSFGLLGVDLTWPPVHIHLYVSTPRPMGERPAFEWDARLSSLPSDWRAERARLEDPHSSDLHHEYAVPHDLPAIPHQTTGRCPVCRGTFEDCTCGGAA